MCVSAKNLWSSERSASDHKNERDSRGLHIIIEQRITMCRTRFTSAMEVLTTVSRVEPPSLKIRKAH